MRKHNIGIIGAGTMAHRMIELLLNHTGFTIAGFFDPSAEAVENVLTAFPSLTSFGSAEILASHSNIDSIYIASPPASHLDYIRMSLGNHKAIFCEKPLSTSNDLANEIVALALTSDAVTGVNFPFATTPSLQYLLTRLPSIGDIENIEIQIRFKTWPRAWQKQAAWLSQRKEGGFCREVLSHFLFAVQRIVREELILKEKSIVYPADNVSSETWLDAAFLSAGIPIRISAGIGGDIDDDNALIVSGKRGRLRMRDWYYGDEYIDQGWRPMPLPENPRMATMQSQLDHLDRLLCRQPSQLATLREAYQVQFHIESLLV